MPSSASRLSFSKLVVSKTVVPKIIAVLLLCPGIGQPALGATNEELEQEVTDLKARVAYLEERLARLIDHAETTATNAAPTNPAPQVAHVEQEETEPERPSMSIGGDIRLDLIANSRSVGGAGGPNASDVFFVPAAIPVDDTGERHQLSSSARASRLWFNATTPTPYGNLGAYIEMDFFSRDGAGNERSSNAYNPRMRHAYASFRNFTLGQTTSTFQNMTAFPEINSGPAGILNTRQPVIRYTVDRDDYSLSFAAEQPETTLYDLAGSKIAVDDDRVPDLVARIDWQRQNGNISLAGVLRELRLDDPVLSDSATGGGLSVSGRWYTRGANNLKFSASYGEGIGRYVSYNSFMDGWMTPAGDLELIPLTAGHVAYQHWWNSRWRSNVVIGYAEADYDAGELLQAIDEQYLSWHLNLFWSPISQASFGIEWLHGRRDLRDGRSAELDRILLTMLYKFRN